MPIRLRPSRCAQVLGLALDGETMETVLREVFDYHHGDLFAVRFWSRMQDRLAAGEVIEIFPYKRSRRLGAALRRSPAVGE